MDKLDIAFIGAGNMASSIAGGLVKAGHPVARIRAADPFPESLRRLADIAPVTLCSDNAEASSGADVIILAVKPQVMAAAMESIAETVMSGDPLVISIAAGVTLSNMQARLGDRAAIVRCMPNTPALIGCGASGLYAADSVSPEQREQAQYILSAVGRTCWVPTESSLDAVTALSGSGPAYFFLFMESMIDAGCQLGLEREVATELALQTGLGAARMALENEVGLTELRRRVTSPGGTTERAIASFEEDGLRDMVSRAVRAAAERAKEMAQEMG